jgi:hypothetical protein
VGTRWLTLYPAVERLAKCWPAVESYFLSLRGDDCPRQIWKYLEVWESGEAAQEETCNTSILCLSQKRTFNSSMHHKRIRGDSITAPELYPLMEKLRNKMGQRKKELVEKSSVSIKKDFVTFYDQSLRHLEMWFDFSDNYLDKIQFLLLKKEPTNSDLKEAVEVLNLKTSINLDELYKELYLIKPTLALFLNDKSKC